MSLYEDVFRKELQLKMMSFFEDLALLGVKKSYSKNEFIYLNIDCVYIVSSGAVSSLLMSKNGKEIEIYRLFPNTIFGENCFIEKTDEVYIYKCVCDCVISIVKRKTLDGVIATNNEALKYLMHSVIRKQRLISLRLAENSFCDAREKTIAHILRYHITRQVIDEKDMKMSRLTQDEIAKRVSLNRSTVSTIINKLKKEGLIYVKDKEIYIVDEAKLKLESEMYY